MVFCKGIFYDNAHDELSTLCIIQYTKPKENRTRDSVISSINLSGDRDSIRTFLMTAASATPTKAFMLTVYVFYLL